MDHISEEIINELRKATELKEQGQYEQAILELEKVIVDEPHLAAAYEEVADNYLSLRELAKSKKALAQALKIEADSANAHYLLGFLESLEQNWQKSEESLIKADHIHPNHPEILRCLGWTLFNNLKKSQGLSVLERSNALRPNDVNILCDLGVCYMNDTQWAPAARTFRQVISLSPESEQAKECRGFLQLMTKANIE